MKNKLLLTSLASLLVIVVLAGYAAAQCPGDDTIVNGTIYQSGGSPTSDPIEGASVTINCLHNGLNYTATTTSSATGYYAVIYPNVFPNDQCGLGDSISVKATHPGYTDNELAGGISYSVEVSPECIINGGEVNVPLIPEFGIMIGGLTVIGSLIAFFVIRRR